jgi:hypothetical protein
MYTLYILSLTLIRMAGGIYDSPNFKQILLKMACIKNIFILDLHIPNKMFNNYILLKVFILKMLF